MSGLLRYERDALLFGVARRALFDRLPRGALPILKEVARHLLRRPVVGIAAVARRHDGHILLVKRGDTGTWGLPGGTMEWGEPARTSLTRELREEAGATVLRTGRLVGVFTAPERDDRMHGVTIVVEAEVAPELSGPENPIEIHEARFFPPDALPHPLAFTGDDMVKQALAGGPAYWE
ncbi:MAG: NUDIX hydrolase [Myxococcales bacterium]